MYRAAFWKPAYLAAVDLYDWLFPFIVVNLLWFGCSVTLILLPPATAALFEMARRSYDNQPPTPRDFFAAMRRWWWLSWRWGAINALLVLAAVVSMSFYAGQWDGAGDFAAGIIGLLTVLALLAQVYVWPYLLLQDTPDLRLALRNSAFTVLGDPALLLAHGLVWLVVGLPGVILIAPVMLVLPMFLALLLSYSLRHWLVWRGLRADDLREA